MRGVGWRKPEIALCTSVPRLVVARVEDLIVVEVRIRLTGDDAVAVVRELVDDQRDQRRVAALCAPLAEHAMARRHIAQPPIVTMPRRRSPPNVSSTCGLRPMRRTASRPRRLRTRFTVSCRARASIAIDQR